MKLFELKGKIENGSFVYELREFKAEQVKDHVRFKKDFFEGLIPEKQLDKFLRGYLETSRPEITIKTLDKSKLKEYKKDIFNIMKDTLSKRKMEIEEQLEALIKTA